MLFLPLSKLILKNDKLEMMKFVKHISRILVGLTFIFSGFVKGIDPWGSAYKFSDYFNALHMEWLLWAAFPLGVLLAFAEFAIGVALLFNTFLRFFRGWLSFLWCFSLVSHFGSP